MERASAVPPGTDTPDARSEFGFGGRQLSGSIDPLCGRDAAGRMVQEPCRGPAIAGRDPRRGAASVTEVVRCQRVVPRRGSRRRARHGLHDDMALPWLSEATRTVDLRSPLVRRSIATAGEREALPWRSLKRANYIAMGINFKAH